jgi:hypothetical protein
MHTYHDICEALGREPSASLRQTLYRARNGDPLNRALPWLTEGTDYRVRWGRIDYTDEGLRKIVERIGRGRL